MVLQHQQGFTLTEVMVTLGMVAIISAVALPSYSGYVARSKVPPGLEALASTATRLEQYYQDTGSYGTASTCANGMVMPKPSDYYGTVSCSTTSSGQGFDLTITGTGALVGYKYSINHRGERKTLEHPKGVPTGNCWSVRGATCDAS